MALKKRPTVRINLIRRGKKDCASNSDLYDKQLVMDILGPILEQSFHIYYL
jgi:hypothetical protein